MANPVYSRDMSCTIAINVQPACADLLVIGRLDLELLRALNSSATALCQSLLLQSLQQPFPCSEYSLFIV